MLLEDPDDSSAGGVVIRVLPPKFLVAGGDSDEITRWTVEWRSQGTGSGKSGLGKETPGEQSNDLSQQRTGCKKKERDG